MRVKWIALVLVATASSAFCQEKKAVDPVMKVIGRGVGGVWRGYLDAEKKTGLVEARYEWIKEGVSLRAHSDIMIGSPQGFKSESFYVVDSAKKIVRYYDFHNDEVFEGTAKVLGPTSVEYLFDVTVGATAKYRSTDEWKDENTLVFTVFRPKVGGGWEKLFSFEMKREK